MIRDEKHCILNKITKFRVTMETFVCNSLWELFIKTRDTICRN